MSNRSKANRPIHVLDRRRRRAVAAAHERAMQVMCDIDSNVTRQNGLFLDDWRDPSDDRVCRAQPNVKWHTVRTYDKAVALVEQWIANGVSIDRMSLDFDLDEYDHTPPRTGVTFLKWFGERVLAESKRPNTTLNINKYHFDIAVHSHHAIGKVKLAEMAATFMVWLDDHQVVDDEGVQRWTQ